MFGIMRPEGGCSYKDSPDYLFHRMHYCGVCKTMGKNYGHKSRLLLNYDTVFLSELLSELSGEDLNSWGDSFQAINRCFNMPKSEMPVSLQYAGDANLFLSELKIDDHVYDGGGLGWRFARWFFNNSFQKASAHLERWNIDTEQLKNWAEEQKKREAFKADFEDFAQMISYYAEPTAQMTGIIFAEGVKACGQEQKSEAAFELGYRFGSLAYLLDAYMDVEKDAFRGHFNPLLDWYGTEKTLSESAFEETRQEIISIQQSIAEALKQLPLSKERQDYFYSRLRSNIALQLYRERIIPLGFRERLAGRWQFANNFARDMTCKAPATLANRLRYQMLSVAVFVAPRTPEYMGMGNKDAFFFTWTAFLAAFITAIGLGVVVGRKRKKKKAERRSAKRLSKAFESLRKGKIFGKNNCWEQLCAACCVACACGCCESCCEGGCNNCMDNCDGFDNNAWIWILLAFAIIVIGVTALLLILL